MKKALIAIALISLTFSEKVQASDQVDTSVNINYTVSGDGTTQVDHQISLVNKTSSTYVSQYTIEIPSNRISNIKASGGQGENLTFSSTSTDTSTILLFNLTSPVVGKNKQNQIKLSYLNPDIAQKVGNILEINLPKLESKEDYIQYNSQLIIPRSYGDPNLITPRTYQTESDNSFTRIKFDKDSLNKGALLLFGNEQYYQLSTTIHLENPSITPIETQFVIPPDTNYQQVFINSINPKPNKLEADSDGNWVVTYTLEAKESREIFLDQSFIIYSKPIHPMVNINQDLNQYISPQKYWEINDSAIQTVSAAHSLPQQMYQYLVDTFKYDFSRIDNQSTHRFGAKQALANPENSLCLEFSDTFIALARSQKIPSRLLTGYAYTQNPNRKPLSLVQNTLHAWPEYFDINSKLWHAIDPTWGQTTSGIDYFSSFDFNHIVFAINGVKSDSPESVGLSTSNQKDLLKVNFIEDKPQEIINLSLSLHTPLTTMLGITDSYQLHIENQSNVAIYDQDVIFSSKGQVFHQQKIPVSLPLSKDTYQLQLPSTPIDPSVISMAYYGTSHQTQISQTKAIYGITIFAFTISIATAIGVFAFRSRSVLVSGQK
jgi:hypothetical protein